MFHWLNQKDEIDQVSIRISFAINSSFLKLFNLSCNCKTGLHQPFNVSYIYLSQHLILDTCTHTHRSWKSFLSHPTTCSSPPLSTSPSSSHLDISWNTSTHDNHVEVLIPAATQSPSPRQSPIIKETSDRMHVNSVWHIQTTTTELIGASMWSDNWNYPEFQFIYNRENITSIFCCCRRKFQDFHHRFKLLKCSSFWNPPVLLPFFIWSVPPNVPEFQVKHCKCNRNFFVLFFSDSVPSWIPYIFLH